MINELLIISGRWALKAKELLQNFQFSGSGTRWSFYNANKTAIMNKGTTGTAASWEKVLNTAISRGVATGNYYFEFTIDNYIATDFTHVKFGVSSGSTNYLVLGNGSKTQGTNPYGGSSFQAYMESTVQNYNFKKYGLGDVIGCSIENVDGNTQVRFYINGVDAGYLGAVAFTLAGTPNLLPVASAFRYNASQEIGVSIKQLKYKPAGFEKWM